MYWHERWPCSRFTTRLDRQSWCFYIIFQWPCYYFVNFFGTSKSIAVGRRLTVDWQRCNRHAKSLFTFTTWSLNFHAKHPTQNSQFWCIEQLFCELVEETLQLFKNFRDSGLSGLRNYAFLDVSGHYFHHYLFPHPCFLPVSPHPLFFPCFSAPLCYFLVSVNKC